jgi:hypothetical protein
VAELTLAQQRALALARARLRVQQEQQKQEPREDRNYVADIGRSLVRGVGDLIGRVAPAVVEEIPELAGAFARQQATIAPGLPGLLAPALKFAPKIIEPAFREAAAPVTSTLREAGESVRTSVAPRQRGNVYEEYERSGVLGGLASLGETVAESAPGTLAALGTALVTRNPRAAAAVMGATSAPQAFVGIRETQKKEGIDDIDRAIVGTAASTALDMFTGVGGAIRSLAGREAAEELFKRGMFAAAQRVASTGVKEGGTEILQNIIEQVAGGADPTTKEAMLNTLEAGMAGMLGGAVFGGATETAGALTRPREETPEPEAPAAETPAPSNVDFAQRVAAYVRAGLPEEAATESALADITREVVTQQREAAKAAETTAPQPEEIPEPELRRPLVPVTKKELTNARNQVKADVQLFADELLRTPTDEEIEQAAQALAQDPSYAAIDLINAVMETADQQRAPVVETAPVEEAPVEEAPAEEAPVEEAPAEEAPVEEAPVEEAPEAAPPMEAKIAEMRERLATEQAADDAKISETEARRAARAAELQAKAQEVQRLNESLGGQPLTVVKGTKIIRGDPSEGTKHEVELNDGTKVYMYRDTDQFGTSNPVWYVEDPLSTERGGWEGYTGSLGSTKKEALERVAERVARGRAVTLESAAAAEPKVTAPEPVAEPEIAVPPELVEPESDELTYDAVAEEIDSALEQGEIDERTANILRGRIDRAMEEMLAGGMPRYAPDDILSALGEVAGEPTAQAAPEAPTEEAPEAVAPTEEAPEFIPNPLPNDVAEWANLHVGRTQKENLKLVERRKRAERNAVEMELPISSLIGIEDQIGRRALQNPSTELPYVEKANGKYYIVDGNHRVVAEYLKGATTIRALVGDLDAATAPEVAAPAEEAPAEEAPVEEAPEAAAPPPPPPPAPPPAPPPSGGGPTAPTPRKQPRRKKAKKVVDRAPLNTEEANAKINDSMNAYKAQVQTQFSLDAAGLLDPLSDAYSKHEIKDTPGLIKGLFEAFRNGDLDEANLRVQLFYLPTRELLEYADLLSGVPEKSLKPMRKARKIKDQAQGMRNTMLNAGGQLLDSLYGFIGSPKRGGARKASALYAAMDITRTLAFNPTAHTSLEAAIRDDGIMEAARDNLARAKRPQERGKAQKQLKEREAMIRKAWQYWEALGKFKGGQQMYKELLDYYSNVTRAFRNEIDGLFLKLKAEGVISGDDVDAISDIIANADATVDKAIKAAHEGELFDDIPTNKFPVVYVPWNRFGQYVLQVKPEFGGPTGGQRYQFESRAERELWAKQLAKQLGVDPNDGNVFERHSSIDRAQRENADEHSVLQEVLKIIRNPKVPLNIDVSTITDPNARQKAVRDFRASIERELSELVLTALPEESIRKQFIKAKGITGRDINHDRVLAYNIQRYANQLPRLKYGYQLEVALSEANDELEGAPDSKGREMAEILLDELGTRMREGVDPVPQNALISTMNNFAHTMMLSAPASAINNGIAIWQRVLPELGVNYGAAKATKVLGKLEGVMRLMGKIEDDPTGNVRSFFAPSIIKLPYIKDNPVFRKAFLDLRDNYNAFGQNFVQQVILGQRPVLARSKGATQSVRNFGTRVSGLLNAPFATMERITNEKAGMAGFILEYEKQKAAGKTDKEAYDAGIDAAYEIISNAIGRYDPSERPPLFQGLGSLLLVFKMYSLNMATYVTRQMTVLMSAVPGAPGKSAFTKAERKQAFKLLAGIYAANAMFTGVAGTFGFSTLMGAFAPLVFLLMDDEEREEWARENPEYIHDMPGYVIEKLIPEVFGGYGDLVAYGPLSALTGVNFSSRLGYDNLFFKDPVSKTGDIAADTKTWFMDNFGAGISRADDFIKGVGAFANGDWRNGLRGIAPAAISAPLKGEEAAREGIVTKKGYQVAPADAISLKDAVTLGLGYQPLKLSKTYSRLYGSSEQLQGIKADQRKLLQKLNRARAEGDYELVLEIEEDIETFNQMYPSHAITQETKDRSERAYESRIERLYRGVEFTPEDRERLAEDIDTYWTEEPLE